MTYLWPHQSKLMTAVKILHDYNGKAWDCFTNARGIEGYLRENLGWPGVN